MPRHCPAPAHLEPWARFIYSRSHFAPSTLTAKGVAFHPRRERTDLSGFMIGGFEKDEAFAHADVHGRQDRPAKALACLTSERIEALRPLVLDFDDEPPRHANVLGFPALDEDERAKERLLDLANQMAAESTLELR